MGWRDYYGFRSNNTTGAAKGFQRSKREFNQTKTPAQKEKIYKNRLNIFSWIRNKSDEDKKTENTIPVSDMEDFSAAGDFGGVLDVYNSYVYQVENSKQEKISIYREMAKYPEISFAVDEYVDEAVNVDAEGKFMDLKIKSDSIKDNNNVRKTLEAEWNHLFYDVIEADRFVESWFREYMIDAEIYLEKLIDNEKPNRGIIGVKKLRTTKCHPIWDDLETEDIAQFVYKTETDLMYMDPEMVAYANSGLSEFNKEEDDKIILGFLEPVKTTYRRLKQLEDALVIYRLVRAPERRVFNIETGQLPKGRAEQYLRDLATKYRQRKYYNPQSGEVSEALDVMAMTEDFWFPVFNGGKQSTVTTLPGGENLGEMDDVDYFRQKMYLALKVPLSRFQSDSGFSLGDTSNITQEEVKFKKQVRSFSNRFVGAFKSIFLTHLKLKGIQEEVGITEADFAVELYSSNLFDKFMEAKILELKFGNFKQVADLIDTDQPLLPKEWALKEFLELDETEYDRIQEMLAAEQAEKGFEEPDEEEGEA